jgi:hypothetical protein
MLLHFCLAALFASAAALPAFAQSATGAIEGLVVDRAGGVLPGVTIALRQPATGAERSAVTGANGLFRAPLLPVGLYELTATLAGFEIWKQADLRLTVGQTITLRLQLEVAGVAETVTVSGAAPVVETGRSHAASTVNETAVQHLPVNGRNFIDFVLLAPGVTRDVRAGDLSFAGQRGTLNSLIVDGADNNNTFFGQTLGRTGSGRAPYQFSQDVVQEFQVISNAYPAEYGRAGGAVINVVTKSGTNELRGSAFEFYRDKALNATSTINKQNHQPKSPYHYHQFGGTAGGPLRRNRDFLLVNYDGQRNTQPNDVFLNLPAALPDDAATAAAVERLRPLARSWSRRLDQDVFFARTDHQLAAAHRLTIRYNHQDFTGEGFEQGGPQQAFEHTGDSLVQTRTLNASWASVFRNVVNELRLQRARDNAAGTANSDDPEAVILHAGRPVLFIGRNNFSPRETTIDRVQVADTLTWHHGAHTVKTGFDVQFDRIDNFFPGFFGGQYVFGSLASFHRGRPDGAGERYQQNFAGPGTSGPRSRPDVRDSSLFLQHEWKPVSSVTVNLGLRYDVMKTAPPPVRNSDGQLAAAGIDTSRFEPDTDNWGPRLGLAWSPDGGRYVVRGGWGVFYGRTPALMLTPAHSTNGVSVISLTFTGGAVPTYPEKFTEIPAGGIPARPNIFYIDRDFSNPRVTHANLAVEWELVRHTSVAVTWLFADGTDLPRSIDRNLGSLTRRTFAIAGSGDTVTYPFFGPDRPFASFGRVIALESSAESRFNGLTVELNRRYTGDAQFRVSYTLGKVVDTVPDATAVAPGVDDAKFASNPVDFEADRTVGNNDQRHRVVASGVYGTNRLAGGLGGVGGALARGWWLSAILTAQSGQPFSARAGAVDLNGDGNTRNDLAPGTRRNAFRLPAIVTFDARVARELPLNRRARLHLIWEAFNLFNRANIDAVDPVLYTVNLQALTLSPNATFGRPLSSAGERIMQLAAKLAF